MARFYYLGPWVLDDKGQFPVWRGPVGTVGSVDLRGSGGGAGLGFFTKSEEITERGYEAFGSAKGDRLDSLTMSAEQRATWASTLGVPESPDGSTLLDMLWDALTVHSDPDGVTGPKPIMPTSRGLVNLHLGGHSLVRSARVPRDPTALPHWGKVQRVLQSGFREVAEVAARGDTQKQRDLHKRWLGFQQEKYGLTAEVATALIVPEDMPRTSPMKPETTITESFTNSDGSPLGVDLTWVEVAGDWIVSGNQARTAGSNTQLAQAASDLSGADHYAQVGVYQSSLDNGVGARVDGSSTIAYIAIARGSGTNDVRLFRLSAGAGYTQLGSTVGHTWGDGDVLRVTADGSDISASVNGSVVIGPITNTVISSGVRAGMWGFGADKGDLDDFEAADIGGAAATRGAPFGSRGVAFNGGRTFMGILR